MNPPAWTSLQNLCAENNFSPAVQDLTYDRQPKFIYVFWPHSTD